MSHSPGPWRAWRMNKTIYVSTPADSEICSIKGSGFNSITNSDVRADNATLIAAAPEMLAMLEHVLATWFPPEIETGIGPVSNSEEIDKLVNLIKKAQGHGGQS